MIMSRARGGRWSRGIRIGFVSHELLRVLIKLVEVRGRFGAVCRLAAATEPNLHDREECRYKKESRYSSQQQAADNGSPERGILLTTITEAQCHRNHANDHG